MRWAFAFPLTCVLAVSAFSVGVTVSFAQERAVLDPQKADARITVKQNGVVIHDNVALPKATPAAPVAEGPEPGPIYLQDHGNPIRFRNIWVEEKK